MILKKTVLILISIIISTNLYSNQTMCYKENLESISAIERVKLDGGLCQGEKTIKEMKNNGWLINDIKSNIKEGKYSYIYIFSKNTIKKIDNNDIDIRTMLKEEIINQKLESKKNEEIKIKQDAFSSGKKIYITKCLRCHGEFANKEPYSTSANISNYNYEKFSSILLAYKFNDYDNGNALFMKPYADILNKDDIKNVFNYIQSIKK